MHCHSECQLLECVLESQYKFLHWRRVKTINIFHNILGTTTATDLSLDRSYCSFYWPWYLRYIHLFDVFEKCSCPDALVPHRQLVHMNVCWQKCCNCSLPLPLFLCVIVHVSCYVKYFLFYFILIITRKLFFTFCSYTSQKVCNLRAEEF